MFGTRSEFTEKMLQKFIKDIGAKTVYITSGSAWVIEDRVARMDL